MSLLSLSPSATPSIATLAPFATTSVAADAALATGVSRMNFDLNETLTPYNVRIHLLPSIQDLVHEELSLTQASPKGQESVAISQSNNNSSLFMDICRRYKLYHADNISRWITPIFTNENVGPSQSDDLAGDSNPDTVSAASSKESIGKSIAKMFNMRYEHEWKHMVDLVSVSATQPSPAVIKTLQTMSKHFGIPVDQLQQEPEIAAICLYLIQTESILFTLQEMITLKSFCLQHTTDSVLHPDSSAYFIIEETNKMVSSHDNNGVSLMQVVCKGIKAITNQLALLTVLANERAKFRPVSSVKEIARRMTKILITSFEKQRGYLTESLLQSFLYLEADPLEVEELLNLCRYLSNNIADDKFSSKVQKIFYAPFPICFVSLYCTLDTVQYHYSRDRGWDVNSINIKDDLKNWLHLANPNEHIASTDDNAGDDDDELRFIESDTWNHEGIYGACILLYSIHVDHLNDESSNDLFNSFTQAFKKRSLAFLRGLLQSPEVIQSAERDILVDILDGVISSLVKSFMKERQNGDDDGGNGDEGARVDILRPRATEIDEYDRSQGQQNRRNESKRSNQNLNRRENVAEATPEIGDTLEDLLALVAYISRLLPSSAQKYIIPNTFNFENGRFSDDDENDENIEKDFVHFLIKVKSPWRGETDIHGMHLAFINLCSALASSSVECAESVFHLLNHGNDETNMMRNVFAAFRYHYDLLTAPAKGDGFKVWYKRIDGTDEILLECWIRLLRALFNSSNILQQVNTKYSIVQTTDKEKPREDGWIDHLVLFLGFDIRLSLKSEITRTLSLVASKSNFTQQIWEKIDVHQVLRTSKGTEWTLSGSSQLDKLPSLSSSSSAPNTDVSYDLETKEKKMGSYVYSTSFLELLWKVVLNSSRASLSNVGFQKDEFDEELERINQQIITEIFAESTRERKEVILTRNIYGQRASSFLQYLRFAVEDVFLKFNSWVYVRSVEKWMIASNCLRVFLTLIESYPRKINDHQAFQKELQNPSPELMMISLFMSSRYKLFDTLVDLLKMSGGKQGLEKSRTVSESTDGTGISQPSSDDLASSWYFVTKDAKQCNYDAKQTQPDQGRFAQWLLVSSSGFTPSQSLLLQSGNAISLPKVGDSMDIEAIKDVVDAGFISYNRQSSLFEVNGGDPGGLWKEYCIKLVLRVIVSLIDHEDAIFDATNKILNESVDIERVHDMILKNKGLLPLIVDLIGYNESSEIRWLSLRVLDRVTAFSKPAVVLDSLGIWSINSFDKDRITGYFSSGILLQKDINPVTTISDFARRADGSRFDKRSLGYSKSMSVDINPQDIEDDVSLEEIRSSALAESILEFLLNGITANPVASLAHFLLGLFSNDLFAEIMQTPGDRFSMFIDDDNMSESKRVDSSMEVIALDESNCLSAVLKILSRPKISSTAYQILHRLILSKRHQSLILRSLRAPRNQGGFLVEYAKHVIHMLHNAGDDAFAISEIYTGLGWILECLAREISFFMKEKSVFYCRELIRFLMDSIVDINRSLKFNLTSSSKFVLHQPRMKFLVDVIVQMGSNHLQQFVSSISDPSALINPKLSHNSMLVPHKSFTGLSGITFSEESLRASLNECLNILDAGMDHYFCKIDELAFRGILLSDPIVMKDLDANTRLEQANNAIEIIRDWNMKQKIGASLHFFADVHAKLVKILISDKCINCISSNTTVDLIPVDTTISSKMNANDFLYQLLEAVLDIVKRNDGIENIISHQYANIALSLINKLRTYPVSSVSTSDDKHLAIAALNGGIEPYLLNQHTNADLELSRNITPDRFQDILTRLCDVSIPKSGSRIPLDIQNYFFSSIIQLILSVRRNYKEFLSRFALNNPTDEIHFLQIARNAPFDGIHRREYDHLCRYATITLSTFHENNRGFNLVEVASSGKSQNTFASSIPSLILLSILFTCDSDHKWLSHFRKRGCLQSLVSTSLEVFTSEIRYQANDFLISYFDVYSSSMELLDIISRSKVGASSLIEIRALSPLCEKPSPFLCEYKTWLTNGTQQEGHTGPNGNLWHDYTLPLIRLILSITLTRLEERRHDSPLSQFNGTIGDDHSFSEQLLRLLVQQKKFIEVSLESKFERINDVELAFTVSSVLSSCIKLVHPKRFDEFLGDVAKSFDKACLKALFQIFSPEFLNSVSENSESESMRRRITVNNLSSIAVPPNLFQKSLFFTTQPSVFELEVYTIRQKLGLSLASYLLSRTSVADDTQFEEPSFELCVTNCCSELLLLIENENNASNSSTVNELVEYNICILESILSVLFSRLGQRRRLSKDTSQIRKFLRSNWLFPVQGSKSPLSELVSKHYAALERIKTLVSQIQELQYDFT